MSSNTRKSSASKIKLDSFDDLFGKGSVQSDSKEHIVNVPLTELHTFKDHPFKVVDDEKMKELSESIKEHGVLTPGTVRPLPNGGYELISGHRRRRACELAGLTTMPVRVRELSDDEATLMMVDANLQREHISFSEKAFAYKLKLKALSHQGRQGEGTADAIGKENGESGRQVQRYIRLTYLVPELLALVDEEKISFIPAVMLSYLSESEQKLLYEKIATLKKYPGLVEAELLKRNHEIGCFTDELVECIMNEGKNSGERRKMTFNERVKSYFPQTYSKKEIEESILDILERWKKKNG